MSHIAHFALALVVVAILALLVCRDRKSIRIRYVIQLLVIEVLLGKGLILYSAVWATKVWPSSS